MVFEKLCSKCGLVKPVDCFYKNKRSKDGYQFWCRVCWKKDTEKRIRLNPERRKEITKESRHKCWFKYAENNRAKSRKYRRDGKRLEIEKRANNKRKIRYLKVKQDAVNYLGGKCKMCGYNKCLGSLEFHHREPNIKEYSIGNKLASMCSNSKTTYMDVIEELDKCDLLCSNCHNELHSYN